MYNFYTFGYSVGNTKNVISMNIKKYTYTR